MTSYEKLKTRVEEFKAAVARATGAHEQMIEALKREFGVDSIEEAQKLLKTLTAKADKAEAEFKKEQTAFEAKWKDVL
jgi:adenylyl- and sulfurtransferase ThiI